MYFLLNFGHGYTGDFVGGMTFDELNWHVSRLNNDLKEKRQAEERQAQKMRQRMRSVKKR